MEVGWASFQVLSSHSLFTALLYKLVTWQRIEIHLIHMLGNMNKHATVNTVFIFRSCTPQLPLYCGYICLFIEMLPRYILGNMNRHTNYKYSIFSQFCMPQLPPCCACICLFIDVLLRNMFGKMNKHSNCKYSIYFSNSARHNFHFVVHAFACLQTCCPKICLGK